MEGGWSSNLVDDPKYSKKERGKKREGQKERNRERTRSVNREAQRVNSSVHKK